MIANPARQGSIINEETVKGKATKKRTNQQKDQT